MNTVGYARGWEGTGLLPVGVGVGNIVDTEVALLEGVLCDDSVTPPCDV